MKRGNLVTYTESGEVISQTGIATGSVLPHEYPIDGLCIEIPYDDCLFNGSFRKVISVNVITKEPIFE